MNALGNRIHTEWSAMATNHNINGYDVLRAIAMWNLIGTDANRQEETYLKIVFVSTYRE